MLLLKDIMTLNEAEIHGQKRYIKDLVEFPTGKEGEDIQRIDSITRLSEGKEIKVKLSTADVLTREGWDVDKLLKARKGDLLFDRFCNPYVVTNVKKGEISIRDAEDENIEGSISTGSRRIKAHEYSYRVDSSIGEPKIITILDMLYKDRSLATVEFFDDLISALPAQHFNSVDEIRIFEKPAGGKAGTSQKGCGVLLKPNVINLYLDQDSYDLMEALETLYHELGHAIAKAIKKSAHPGKAWKAAMDADGNMLSEYAEKARYPKLDDNGEVEDFAEAVRLYLSADGAKTTKNAELRNACENRFKILDELFSNPVYQQQFGTRRVIGRLLRKQSPLK